VRIVDEAPEAPEAPATRGRRRWPWIVLAALFALAIAVRVALPYAIVWGAGRGARDAVGLPLEIADVDLGVFRGSLILEDVALGRAGGAAREKPLLRLDRLAARLSWPALLAGRIQLGELAVEGPVVRLARLADGSLENPLPPRPAEPEAPAPEPKEGSSWPLRVDALRVSRLDFELAEPAREAPAVGFALEELALRDLALEGENLTLGGVGVRGPRLRVERSFVFAPSRASASDAGTSAPTAEPAPAPTPAAPAEPPAAPADEAPSAAPAAAAAGPSYRLERVAIERAGISLLTDQGPLDVELDFAAEGVSARAGETFPLHLAVRVGGGELRVEGHAGLAPIVFDGSVRWSELPVPLFVLAARPDLASWVESCRAEGELRVALRLQPGAGSEEAAVARFSGQFAVRDLALGDPGGREVGIRWKALEVGVREGAVPLADPAAPVRVALERVRLDGPALRYARPTPALDALLGVAPAAEATAAEGAEEVAEAPAPPEAAPAAPGDGEPAPVELEIDAVELRGGSLAFDDRSLDPPYRGAVTGLSVVARDVRWPALRARGVRVRGVAPDRAPFTLSGNLDGKRGEFVFELQRLTLPELDPYAAGAGYKLARGEATVRTKLVLDPARYATENDLLLHDLRLDSANAGAFEEQFGTSLDFALALLRDASGDIRLPVPVVVERENLRLGLGRIVLGALRAALVGVVSSPLKALGAALPGGGAEDVDLATLPSAPGQAELAADAGPRVEALAGLLRSRPLLALELAGRSGPADRPVLAERIAIERATAGEPLPEVEGAGFLARRRVAEALRARGRGEAEELSAEDEALLASTVAAVEVPGERLQALARERASGVQAQLVAEHGVDAARVQVTEPASEGEPGVAIELVARVEGIVGAQTPGEAPAPAPPAAP
jgi:hypothetical protein